MLINLRNALMSGKRLPYDAEVEYLESSGTQYINTGIKPGPNIRAEIVFAMTTFTANCGLFGARGNAAADNNSYNLFIISNSGARVRWDWSGSGQYQTSEADTSTDATYVLGAAGGNITRNGTTVMSVSASKAAINYPLYVFNFNNVGTPYSAGANARFWSVKIYDGQTLVFDAIPVRKGTVGYLYDRVSGKLFGNEGTGDFALGPDVVPVEYIESHGTEWIDTRYYLTNGTELEAVTQSTDGAQRNNTLIGCGTSSSSNDRVQLHLGSGVGVATVRIDGQLSNDVAVGTTTFTSRLDIRHKKAYINNQEVISSYNGSICTIRPVALFNRMIRDGVVEEQYGAKGRIYSVQIYDLGVPVRSFRPVRVGTDATSWEGAMMDVLTRRIYRNAGTGAFTYGNDLKYPIPSE